mmetsp:Transcript_7484/g.5684  ORF Transcript_7484/g.5684 Transcript_7484/m.5684 type:complete len:196 (+) Transcript_7484:88-675(+)|eukprot:CAMPEP_0202979280 /NCGR_PEP_ID=MMETSP1396-20130829/85473_1 /ASSEMBLY_ACC=CAM_ASM_000872 /TAXON_ID= /ORGANISM="Pseudokeronopsis sp., Strain Brazil" /LENGTH=195 /DNA_ID=CAMNT_0049718637 /DNA_START=87 /DNA_END=674 /DNA_ORIENTATION=-
MISDPQKIEQLLLNLLLNAQKFTQMGFIKLKVTTYVVNEQGEEDPEKFMEKLDFLLLNDESINRVFKRQSRYVRFMVVDTGFGIPEEKLSSIFNLFQHNSNLPLNESFKNKSSAGLGLTISQNISRMLGSQIKCKSVVGQGTVFYFDLIHRVSPEELLKKPSIMPNAAEDPLEAYYSFNVKEEEQAELKETLYIF